MSLAADTQYITAERANQTDLWEIATFIQAQAEHPDIEISAGKEAIHRYQRIVGAGVHRIVTRQGLDLNSLSEPEKTRRETESLEHLFLSEHARLYRYLSADRMVGIGSIAFAQAVRDSIAGESPPMVNIEYYLEPGMDEASHLQAATHLVDEVHGIDLKKMNKRLMSTKTRIVERNERGNRVHKQQLAIFGATVLGAVNPSIGIRDHSYVKSSLLSTHLSPTERNIGDDPYDISYGNRLVDVYLTK